MTNDSHSFRNARKSGAETASLHINLARNLQDSPVWHRNLYERVIRNERELNATRHYIANNPA